MGPPPTNHEVSAAYWDLSIQLDHGTTTHEVSAVYWDPSIQLDNGTTTHEVSAVYSVLRPEHPDRQWDHHPRTTKSVQSTETPASS